MKKRDFDPLAATWDTPARVKLAADLLEALTGEVPLTPETDVADFGFDRETLRESFHQAGFVDVRHRTASEILKPGPGDQPRRYPVFLIVGRT